MTFTNLLAGILMATGDLIKTSRGSYKQKDYLQISLTVTLVSSIMWTIAWANPVLMDQSSFDQFQFGRNIRNIPCVVRKSGRSGVCMFAIDCIKQNGTHLGTCIDRFYFGSCCQLTEDAILTSEINENSIDQNTISHFVHDSSTLQTSTLNKIVTEIQGNRNVTQSFAATTLPTAAPHKVEQAVITSTSTTFVIRTTSRPSEIKNNKRPQNITTNRPYVLTTIIKRPLTTANSTTTETKLREETTELPIKTSTLHINVNKTTTPNIAIYEVKKKPIKTKPYTNIYISTTTAMSDTKNTSEAIIQTTVKPTEKNSTTQKPETIKPLIHSSTQSDNKRTSTERITTSTISTSSPTITTTMTPTKSTTTSETEKKPSVPKSTTTSKPLILTSTSTNKVTNSSKLPLKSTTPKITTTTTTSTTKLPTTTTTVKSTTTTTTPPSSTDSVKISASSASTTAGVNQITQQATALVVEETTTTKNQLVTWYNIEKEPITDTKNEIDWQPHPSPLDWVVVSTIPPESLKNSTMTEASASHTTKPYATTTPMKASTVEILTTENPTVVNESSTQQVITTTNATTVQSETNHVTTSSEESDEKLVSTTIPSFPIEEVKYKQICGRRMFPEPRIVGGAHAAFGRWPWQVSLRQWRTSTYLHKCGAALLNENWAITAAHCVDNVPPSDLLLRLGEYDLAEEDEPYGYQERRVQIVASHPQFDPRTFEYDLALLRFYEPVIFQPNIIPICVPDSDNDFIGQTAYVTGWGRLFEDGPLPSVLQEVAVPVINNTICESMYRSAGYIEHIPHIFICAGWKKGGYDSCEGDSGGPMVLQRESDKRFLLSGVISWGIGCAEANQPGVYTRISEFRDWINQILQF